MRKYDVSRFEQIALEAIEKIRDKHKAEGYVIAITLCTEARLENGCLFEHFATFTDEPPDEPYSRGCRTWFISDPHFPTDATFRKYLEKTHLGNNHYKIPYMVWINKNPEDQEGVFEFEWKLW
jgi:hypothetical protein